MPAHGAAARCASTFRRTANRLAHRPVARHNARVTRAVALLRAVNVGNRKVPMADLRALAGGLGLANASTFIASGNLLFDDAGDAALAEARLENALRDRFGFDVPVIVRLAEQWPTLLAANPFTDAARERPNLVMVGLSKRPIAADTLAARAADGERVAVSGNALWFDFVDSSARSKLTPTFIDRAAGSPVTTRNWRTAVTLGELLAAGS